MLESVHSTKELYSHKQNCSDSSGSFLDAYAFFLSLSLSLFLSRSVLCRATGHNINENILFHVETILKRIGRQWQCNYEKKNIVRSSPKTSFAKPFFFSWLFWCVLVLVYLTYCCSYCCFCGRYFEFVSRLNYFLTSFCVYYCPFATVYVSIYAPTAIFVDFFRHNRTVKFPFKFNCIKNKNPCTYNVESMP